tara:strand:+ start:48921 stop:49310 length:390 start_codon:yes stop_codon:yes gene_type:complete
MHIIRLKHPWNKLAANAMEPSRVNVPEIAIHDDATEEPIPQATYTRFFNCPSGLDQDSKVLLSIGGWQGRLESILLNGEPLEHGNARAEFDITSRLSRRNELAITLASETNTECRLSGEVTLVIDAQVD